MHSYVTSKNVKWCHLIWPTLYVSICTAKAACRVGHWVDG